MNTDIFVGVRHIRCGLRIAAFGFIFVTFLLLALGANSSLVLAEEDTGNGTVPPVEFFTKASPFVVQQGGVVTFEIGIISGEATYVDVVIGLTSTLPSGVTVIPGTINVKQDVGEVGITTSNAVTWTGRIEQPGSIIITYQAQVAADTCGQKSSQALLYEIENVGAQEPTDKQIEGVASFNVEGECKVYLPELSLALTSIPVLQNWNFENGASAPGWGQYDNDRPSTLIYSTDKKPLQMPQGGSWFGWLGGVLNMRSELRQQVALPADHMGIELRFLYLIESAEECGADNGYVLLGGVQIGNTFQMCKPTAQSTWQMARISVPPSLLGKESMLILRSVTSPTKNSNWLVDNVEFCSTDARAAAADRCN